VGGIFIAPVAGGTVAVLQKDPAATADANAVYLLSAVVPANTLKAGSGGVLIALDGVVTTQAGGAALNTTTLGLVIRNSVGGVPTTPFPAGIYTPFEASGPTAGLIDNAAGASLSLFASSYTFDQADQYGSVLTVEAQSNVAGNPFRAMSTFPLADQLVAPNFASETLWQIVLVQNFNVACIPPANFAAWASTSSQIATFT